MNEKSFYHKTYAVSMDDLMEVWVETFHPFGTVLVIWDAKNYFDDLQESGLVVKSVEAYNNKAVTVEVEDPLEAYKIIDTLKEKKCEPFMQVYINGRLISDNVAPIY